MKNTLVLLHLFYYFHLHPVVLQKLAQVKLLLVTTTRATVVLALVTMFLQALRELLILGTLFRLIAHIIFQRQM